MPVQISNSISNIWGQRKSKNVKEKTKQQNGTKARTRNNDADDCHLKDSNYSHISYRLLLSVDSLWL